MKHQSALKETEIGMIPNDWKVASLKDTCTDISYGYTASACQENTGPKFLRITDIVGKVIDWQSVPYCEIEPSQKKKYELQNGDIVIARTGANTGATAIIKKPPDAIFASYLIRFRIDPQKTAPFFVGHALKSTRWNSFVQEIIGGSAQPGANAQQFGRFQLPLPPLPEQFAVAKILSDLDTQIELNQQMNTTLENIGQTLFKHWFVDFEFLNDNGKPYKSSSGKMVDSELGEIPEGWVVGTLGDICDITMGQSPPGHSYNEDGSGLPFYQGIADFGFRFPSRRVYCTAPTRFAEEGDVLLSVRAPVGAFNVAEERCAIGRGIAALRLKEKHNGFLYYLLRATRSEWEKFEAEGTVFGSVTKSDVHDFKVVIPPQPLLAKFALLIEGLEGKININEKQSRNLTAIRDSLLPRLMSGKIGVGMAK